MKYTLPDLPYAYDALEPYIDEKTLRVHHQGHHKTYVDKLNQTLEPYPDLQLALEVLLTRIDALPAEIQTSVQNNGGGHANHTLFWSVLRPVVGFPPSQLSEALSRALERDFSTFQNFQDRFTETAIAHFSNGWVWLSAGSNGDLLVHSTKDHQTPLSEGRTPLLVIDVWEHAYYLSYQNRRAEFVKKFWPMVNWEEVSLRWDEFCAEGTTQREWRAAS